MDVAVMLLGLKSRLNLQFFSLECRFLPFPSIQDPIKERFDGRAPYIKYTRGENSGLVGFYKPLSEEDIEFVRNTIKTINNNEVTWSSPNGWFLFTSSRTDPFVLMYTFL